MVAKRGDPPLHRIILAVILLAMVLAFIAPPGRPSTTYQWPHECAHGNASHPLKTDHLDIPATLIQRQRTTIPD
jgi:hypothetical protein